MELRLNMFFHGVIIQSWCNFMRVDFDIDESLLA